jgi:hypothetical protein
VSPGDRLGHRLPSPPPLRLVIGDTAFSRPPGVAWRVYGRNGENIILAEGRTRDETRAVALEQAGRWRVPPR